MNANLSTQLQVEQTILAAMGCEQITPQRRLASVA